MSNAPKWSTEQCEHERVPVEFDSEASRNLSASDIRARWPRFHGNCPDCGANLIKYASFEHYIAGDW